MREKLALDVACVGLVLASLSCGAGHSATPARAPSTSAPAADTWTSPRFSYKWTLSPAWEFSPVEGIGAGQKRLAIDVVGAKPKGKRRPSAMLYVYDYTIVERTRAWGDPADYEALERFGEGVLASNGIEHVGTRRITMFGQGGVEVVGTLEDEGFSIRMVRRDRRHFEVRCLGSLDQPEWPCESAFKAFAISEPPARPAPEGPRVLHLREPRFGLEFDAPDDSWLATGPHTGGGGAQLVWMWRRGDQQVDVQVMDFRGLPAEPTEEQFLVREVEYFERKGGKVVVANALLGGEPCHHLSTKQADGWFKDVFFLHRNSINYTMLITQRKRDPKLITKATKGFRFTLLEQERDRQQASYAQPVVEPSTIMSRADRLGPETSASGRELGGDNAAVTP